jgi:hypothetical protein
MTWDSQTLLRIWLAIGWWTSSSRMRLSPKCGHDRRSRNRFTSRAWWKQPAKHDLTNTRAKKSDKKAPGVQKKPAAQCSSKYTGVSDTICAVRRMAKLQALTEDQVYQRLDCLVTMATVKYASPTPWVKPANASHQFRFETLPVYFVILGLPHWSIQRNTQSLHVPAFFGEPDFIPFRQSPCLLVKIPSISVWFLEVLVIVPDPCCLKFSPVGFVVFNEWDRCHYVQLNVVVFIFLWF